MRRLEARTRYSVALGAGVASVAGIALVVAMAIHPPYAAGSPAVRVTIAGGCPRTLGGAVDVANPGGSSWFSKLRHYPRLAPPGATGGLVCAYPTAALGHEVRLDGADAAFVAAAAHAVSPTRPRASSTVQQRSEVT